MRQAEQASGYAKSVIWNEREGKRIYGEVFLPEGAERSSSTGEVFPTVILAHGLGSDTTHMEPYARLLAQHGFVAYAFDFCGGGLETKSDGTTLDMTVMTEREDLLAAVALMLGQPYVDKDALFLLGNSQGGYVSAMVAEEMPDAFRALALIYPGFVLRDSALMRYPEGSELPERDEALGVALSRAYIEAVLSRDPYEHMADYGREVLIVHGDKDEIVPISYSHRALSTYPSARLEVIEGAGHGFKDGPRDRAAELVLGFFSEVLEKDT